MPKSDAEFKLDLLLAQRNSKNKKPDTERVSEREAVKKPSTSKRVKKSDSVLDTPKVAETTKKRKPKANVKADKKPVVKEDIKPKLEEDTSYSLEVLDSPKETESPKNIKSEVNAQVDEKPVVKEDKLELEDDTSYSLEELDSPKETESPKNIKPEVSVKVDEKPIVKEDIKPKLEEDTSYSWEKLDTLKTYANNVAAFFKHGIYTSSYLRELDDNKEEEIAQKMADMNVFDGEIQYDPEFEEEVKEIFSVKTTYRNLYQHLVIFIEDNLRNTKEGITICNANVVRKDKDYENFSNIIFSMIRAAIDTQEISYENVLKTSNYLNVPSIIVQGLFSNEALLKPVIDFTTTISIMFFEDEKQVNKVNHPSEMIDYDDKESILEDQPTVSEILNLPEEQPKVPEIISGPKEQPIFSKNVSNELSVIPEEKSKYVNIYQELFAKYGGDVVLTENQERVLFNSSTKEMATDEESIEQHEVACTWYCLVCRVYNKKVLSADEWKALPIFLECINNSTKEEFPKGIIESASKYGLEKSFIKTIISIDELFRVFVEHVRNNTIRRLMAEQNLSSEYKNTSSLK